MFILVKFRKYSATNFKTALSEKLEPQQKNLLGIFGTLHLRENSEKNWSLKFGRTGVDRIFIGGWIIVVVPGFMLSSCFGLKNSNISLDKLKCWKKHSDNSKKLIVKSSTILTLNAFSESSKIFDYHEQNSYRQKGLLSQCPLDHEEKLAQ